MSSSHDPEENLAQARGGVGALPTDDALNTTHLSFDNFIAHTVVHMIYSGRVVCGGGRWAPW